MRASLCCPTFAGTRRHPRAPIQPCIVIDGMRLVASGSSPTRRDDHVVVRVPVICAPHPLSGSISHPVRQCDTDVFTSNDAQACSQLATRHRRSSSSHSHTSSRRVCPSPNRPLPLATAPTLPRSLPDSHPSRHPHRWPRHTPLPDARRQPLVRPVPTRGLGTSHTAMGTGSDATPKPRLVSHLTISPPSPATAPVLDPVPAHVLSRQVATQPG